MLGPLHSLPIGFRLDIKFPHREETIYVDIHCGDKSEFLFLGDSRHVSIKFFIVWIMNVVPLVKVFHCLGHGCGPFRFTHPSSGSTKSSGAFVTIKMMQIF